jgi:hypothetical protein
VVSAGAGLDTRPWRLQLPPDLRWLEVDFPAILDYKDSLMATEKLRCRRERLTADLNDAAQRRAVRTVEEMRLTRVRSLLIYREQLKWQFRCFGSTYAAINPVKYY